MDHNILKLNELGVLKHDKVLVSIKTILAVTPIPTKRRDSKDSFDLARASFCEIRKNRAQTHLISPFPEYLAQKYLAQIKFL